MKRIIDPQKFTVYRLLTENDKYVAIPNEYLSTLELAVKDFGTLKNVPVDKTVRGIFLVKENNNFQLDEDAQQNDITINQLELF